ncbi:MAG: LamG domain-containing protein, partial [Chitinivibrionales bacterium]|nr:LamG domain-containing protein [Chitinivibrionales bacterium]
MKIETLRRLQFALFLVVVMAILAFGQNPIASWSFDSTTGNTFYDGTGHGYDAVGMGTEFSLVPGLNGQALSCGASGYDVAVSNSNVGFSLDTLTIETWFNAATLSTGSPQKILDYCSIASGVHNGYSFWVEQGHVGFGFANTDGSAWIVLLGTTTLVINKWYHLVASFDGTTVRVYVNGVLDGISSYIGGIKVPPVGTTARIGVQKLADGTLHCYANGKIDELKLYNYALNAAAINANYQVLANKANQSSQRIVAAWSFDSAGQAAFGDISGNNHSITNAGTAVGFVPGVKNNALECPINSSYKLEILNSRVDFNMPNFSIEAWIYSSINTVNPGSFYNYKTVLGYLTLNAGISEGYAFQIIDDGRFELCLSQTVGAGWVGCISDSIIKPNTWYHVAGTYDGSDMRLYINGVLVKQTHDANGYIMPHSNAFIGSQVLTDGTVRDRFYGKIDELTVYNYALDAAAIAQHYAAITPPVTPPFKINFGMNHLYANAGDTLWMPIYLTNYEAFSINACQFTLHLDTTVVRLLAVSKDSGMVKSWMTPVWNQNAHDS